MEKIATFTTPEARFLSNFYPYKKDGSKYEFPTQVGSLLCSDKIKVFLEGLCFDCTENAYQAASVVLTACRQYGTYRRSYAQYRKLRKRLRTRRRSAKITGQSKKAFTPNV